MKVNAAHDPESLSLLQQHAAAMEQVRALADAIDTTVTDLDQYDRQRRAAADRFDEGTQP